jgi:hypothetical protein
LRVSAVADDVVGELTIAADAMAGSVLLSPHGVLDSSTYRSLRDRIIKAALDEPEAVIVDVSDLRVPAESAWAVFTSARWHVGIWPEVPIMLVCAHLAGRSALTRNGISRYVPVYASLGAAFEAVSCVAAAPLRRRARATLPAEMATLRRARELVTDWLTAWSQTELVPVTKVVVTTLIENVLQHTADSPGLRLEFNGSAVTVAVEDTSHAPAILREAPGPSQVPSGLRIVAALCRAWGNAPTSSGKTVWAVVGPENRL